MQEYQQNTDPLSFEKVWAMFQETDLKFQETDLKFQETDRKFQETMKATDKQIKELGKQIGGLGNKFGSFNEGLFMPSLKKMLKSKFNCRKEAPRYVFNDNGNSFEIDLLGISETACYLVEIKSKLGNDAIDQIEELLKKFRNFDDFSLNKKLYGIICATDYSDEAAQNIIKKGFYFISTSDDIAKLKIPKNFKPKEW